MSEFNFKPAEELLGKSVILTTKLEDKHKAVKVKIEELLYKYKQDFQDTEAKVSKLYDKFEAIELEFDDDASDSEIDKAEKRLQQLSDAFDECVYILNNLEEIQIYD